MGQQKKGEAEKALKRLGETEGMFGTTPKTTPHFNQKEGRYIYTEKGGWVDMVHFLFYAGKAYQYKKDGEKNPIGEAVQDGYWQEKFDSAHSAFSYEDLPSDKFGADFAVNHFDPNSDLTFAEQVQNYLNNVLKATDPQKAPNYNNLPEGDSKKEPSRKNKTTTPVYTKENP
jgi:filamentous hemagglutinin